MKISTKVEFGIIALADIAIYSENGNAVSSADISKREDISQKYLEQILVTLRQAGFIRGQKGSRGGYTLARRASKIYFSEILNGLDNSILADTYSADDDNESGLRSAVSSCIWDKLNGFMREYTSGMTLEDLIEKYRKDSADEAAETMYYI